MIPHPNLILLEHHLYATTYSFYSNTIAEVLKIENPITNINQTLMFNEYGHWYLENSDDNTLFFLINGCFVPLASQ